MIKRIQPGARYSEASIYNGVAYLAGQVAADASGDIKAQTRSVLDELDRLLTEVGSDKSRILMATVYLADMADYSGMNEAWDGWVVSGHAPARATVQALLARPEWKIEIAATAAVY